MWGLFTFQSVQHPPSVVRLDLYQPNLLEVYFAEGSEQLDTDQSLTSFNPTEYIRYKSKYERADATKYANYPCYFIWNEPDQQWASQSRLIAQTLSIKSREPGSTTETGNFQGGQSYYTINHPGAGGIGTVYNQGLEKARYFIYLRFCLVFQLLYLSAICGL